MEPDIVNSEYFSSYDDYEVHRLMIEDEPRILAYKNAIFNNKDYFNNKVVMDVGCGTGILSIFCAQAGAKKVYAIEASNVANLAKEIVKENKFENIIEVIQCKVEDLQLPDNQKVDAIVSEWMGFFLLHEGMLDSVLFARDNFLKEDGQIFPESATIYVSPCSTPGMFEKWDDVNGVSMKSMAKALRNSKRSKPDIMAIKPEDILSSEDVALCWVNLREDTVADINSYQISQVFAANKDALFQGICIWFECLFPNLSNNNDNVRLDTGPSSPLTHWKQSVIILPGEQKVEKGEAIAFYMSLERDAVHSRRYNISVTLLDPEDCEHPIPCSCDLTKCMLIKAYMKQHPAEMSSKILEEDSIEDQDE